MLQNCHLYLVFDGHAEEQEDLRGRPAPTRPRSPLARALIRLTSTCPRTSFPSYLLQNGVKMINEPPRLLRSYSNLYGIAIRFLFTLRYDLYDATLGLRLYGLECGAPVFALIHERPPLHFVVGAHSYSTSLYPHSTHMLL